MGGQDGHLHTQVLADQLTLSQSEGADCAPLYTVKLAHPALGSFLHPCLSRYENKERKLFVFFPLRRLLSSLPRQTNAFQKPVHICLHYATWWLVGCEVLTFGRPHVQTLGLSKSLFFILTIFGVTYYEEKCYALGGYLDALRLAPSCHCKDGHIFWNIFAHSLKSWPWFMHYSEKDFIN